jgi:hypothetical protein
MPATSETIPDRARFDVYAMMIILTCAFTGGATWMLYDDLTTHWGYGKEVKPEKAVHITKINSDPEKYPDVVNLTEEDKKDYELAQKAVGTDTTLSKGFEWPAGFDPLNYAVRPPNLKSVEEPAGSGKFVLIYNDPALSAQQNQEKQAEFVKNLDALMNGYKGPATAPKEAPKEGAAPAVETSKPAEAPAAPTPPAGN